MHPAKEVHEIVKSCLFTPEEVPSEGVPQGAILVEGLTMKIGFHPERLARAKPRITKLIKELVQDDFLEDKGGGMSFLSLCEARDGSIWGQHRDMEALLVLAIATEQAKILLPRHLWSGLPGGLPYVSFSPM